MHDLLHEAAKVAIALGVVERAKLGRRDAVVLVRLENSARLLPSAVIKRHEIG